GTAGTIVSTGDHNRLVLRNTQNVIVTGTNTSINNMGTGMDITLGAPGDSMYANGTNNVTGSNNITRTSGTQVNVTDSGTHNLTLADAGNSILAISDHT